MNAGQGAIHGRAALLRTPGGGLPAGSHSALVSRRRRWIERALVAYAVVASALGSALFARSYPELAEIPFWRLTAWQGPGYLLWALMLPVIAWAGARIRPYGTARSVAGLAALGFLLVPAHALCAAWWFAYVHPLGGRDTTLAGLRGGLVQRTPIDFLMYCAIVGVVYARDYALRFGEEKARAERLERELLTSKLEGLLARLRPHFLFNTLQSITVLIRRDPEGAVRMTKDLAALLRHSLETADRPLVTLGSEVELLERYVAIEQARFSDRLEVSFAIDPRARPCLVPDLLLQPLVENAIHHGVAPLPQGGHVAVRGWVEGTRLCIEIRDDGVGLPEGGPEERVGLGVTRSRLEGLYGAEHVFSLRPGAEGGTVVSVEMPARSEAPWEGP